MTHWTETLFREQADLYVPFFEERFDAAEEQADRLLDLLAAEFDADPETALDVACGAGRHVLAFADRGLDAEGLDFSGRFLEEARERARERGLSDDTAFRHHDMRELDELTGSYDLVTSFWNSLGYYDRETDERILAEARRLLSEDGVLAVELGNKDHYVANFEGSVAHEDDGRLHVQRREYDVATGRFHTQLDLFDAEGGYEYVDRMEWENRVYAPPTLRDMCLDAGFVDVSLFGGFDGAALTVDSDTVALLAR